MTFKLCDGEDVSFMPEQYFYKLTIAPYKVICESLGFWLPRCGFPDPRHWIPDSKRVGMILDSLSWILADSKSTGFQIPDS